MRHFLAWLPQKKQGRRLDKAAAKTPSSVAADTDCIPQTKLGNDCQPMLSWAMTGTAVNALVTTQPAVAHPHPHSQHERACSEVRSAR